MNHVTSKDETSIAYDRLGSGPAVVLVGGAAVDRSENAPLAAELAAHFTTYNYDRRGRGDSGDTAPYALEREIEDIAAMIAAAGGSAHLYGLSSGGALVLEAAAAGVAADRIAVYEVPYNVAPDAEERHRRYVDGLAEHLADGRRGDAFAHFMRTVGSPDHVIESVRTSPAWARCEAIAPTLLYDAACLGDGRPPVDRLATISQPTLVATGGASADTPVGGATMGFFDAPADAIAAAVPTAERQVVEGQTHRADPKVMAGVLGRFFTAG